MVRETGQTNTVGREGTRGEFPMDNWGRGLMHRLDQASAGATFAFCSLQVEMPSHRWFQLATDGGRSAVA